MKKASLISFTVAEHGRARVRIRGNSMLPVLRDGMIAEVEALVGRPRKGDVLIYDMGHGPIAHRVMHCVSDERFVVCGDAIPHDIEHIRANAVLGRIVCVWHTDHADAPSVSRLRLQLAGAFMVHTRALRATCARIGVLLRQTATIAHRPRIFQAMLLALRSFFRGDSASALDLLHGLPLDELFAMIARHGTAGHLLRFLEQAKQAGYEVNEPLYHGLRSSRWRCALHADLVLARVREVQPALRAANIDAIYLKGSARLLAGESDADIHFSGDVDILVPMRQADDAVAALQACGFDFHATPTEQRFYQRYVQHRSPLWKSDAILPVEVHTQLVLPGSVSQRLSYHVLYGRSMLIDSVVGEVRVLDAVATAVHLAYHGRDFRRMRDAGLLALKLSAFSPSERTAFDRIIAREKRDGLRLRCLVKLVDDWNGEAVTLTFAERTFLSWIVFREDLPSVFRQRAPLLDGLIGQCLPSYQGMRHIVHVLYAWCYNVITTPLILMWFLREKKRYCDALTRPNGSRISSSVNC